MIGRVLGATVLAGAAELVVLRLVTRTAVHIPGLSALDTPYVIVAGLGRFAYYAAALLLIATLCVLIWEASRRRTRASIAVAASLVVFFGASALARAGLATDGALDLASVGAVVIVAIRGIAGPAVGNADMPRRASVTLFASAFLGASLYAMAEPGDSGGAPAWLLPISELLLILWCLGSPLLTAHRIDRIAAAWGIAVATSVFGALAASEATVKVLLLWNFGVAGSFPAWTYALSFGSFAYAFVAALRAGRSDLGMALALLAIGGVGLHSTYQTGMVLVGLVLLGAERPARRVGSAILVTEDQDIRALAEVPVHSAAAFLKGLA